jgi:hypothetical protein
MTVQRCTYLAISLLAACVTLNLSAQQSKADDESIEQEAPASAPVSKAVVPQIVRVSYVQGDVRVSRGKQGKHDGGAVWEQAAVNLPLETGFSLVTGTGRVEIEFEDASTMYLGENSVLTFGNLTSKEDVPSTEMALLSGYATFHLKPEVAGESYFIKTPTDSLHVPFGVRADMRVNSYLDAVALTLVLPPQVAATQAQAVAARVGTTITYSDGVKLSTTHPAIDHFADWDSWVAKRVVAREQAMSAVMGEAGLETPLPGLADMKAKGRFFNCAPYGTCWEPNGGWGKTQQASVPQQASGPQAGSAQLTVADEQGAVTTPATPTKKAKKAQLTSGGYGSVPMMYEDEIDFPCSPYAIRSLMVRDPFSGEDELLDSDWTANASFDWAVCHAGSWIPYGQHYAWVVGRGRHHQLPVRWVAIGNKLAYVPVHPKDALGKAPLNLKHGIFVAADRKATSFEHVSYDPKAPVKVLAGTPRNFRSPILPALSKAEAPTVAAHVLQESQPGVTTPIAARPVNTISFDHRSQSFLLNTRVTEGGRSSTFTNSMGGRVGSAQPSGPMLAGGYRGGAATANGVSSGTSGGGSRGGSGGASSVGGSRGGFSGGTSTASSSSTGSSGSMSSGSSMSSGAASGGGHPK